MKSYKEEEWDLTWPKGEQDTVDNRIYIDLEGNRITGILEEFKSYGKEYFKANPYETNSVIVRDGKYGHQ